MKIPSLIALVLLASVSLVSAQQRSAPAPPMGVPKDAEPFHGKWYRAYPGMESWEVAKERCANFGGGLAVIHDRETQDFLAHMANRRIFWLGATNEPAGEWKWLDGTKFSYTNWLPGQPSNFKNHEHWLALGKDGRWFDIDHKSPLVAGFICEWKKK